MKQVLSSVLFAVLAIGGSATVASAGAPVPISFNESFPDVDPCTGEMQTVNSSVVFWVHEHGDRVVARGDRTVTTSGGYAGSGTSSYVFNGQTEVFRVTDVLSHEDGRRLRATAVFLLDLRTDTVRLDRFDLSCLR